MAYHSLFEIIISITGKPSQAKPTLIEFASSFTDFILCYLTSYYLPDFRSYFNHSVWHLFVLAGSIFHWSGVYIIAK